MTQLTVKLFGPQARLAQSRQVVVEVQTDRPTSAEVLSAVAVACPALSGSIPASKLAVNQTVVDTGDRVCPDDELAVIGMLGGG